MSVTIDEIVAQVREWQGKQVEIHPLSGGLTNANYRLVVEGVPYVVRIPGAKTELLAIDRGNEVHNTKASAEAGVGPRVVHYLPQYEVMALEFIYGQTMSNAALNAPGMPARIAASLKLLHAGPRFLLDFNMFRLTEFYLDIVKQHAVVIPEDYWPRMSTVRQIETAMNVHPLPTVPCHNDLLAENYIDDGRLLRLIDYEYSGNNDPTFELGNTCQELQYSDAQIAELCAAYFGAPSPAMIARMKLNMIMSDVGWGLWAAIQAKISTIDFDFWGWAVERWGRAVQKMDSPEFPFWLRQVQQ
ncbi:MAG: phosphotransferase [Chloroflexi bacterium]|nr:phosphotransferase [Chloroflexota bacterium]